MLSSLQLCRCIKGLWEAIAWNMLSEADSWYSEIAPARRRGGVVVLNHIGMVSGLAVAFW
jgi:hypothetical protein